MLLRDPAALENPFYALAPPGFHYPLVALATIATVIASQAVISGVFSITRQSVQLGQLPRMEIRHTSATDYGQIYVPRANTLMLIGVIAIVLIYKNSDALAAAYGMAVTGMMSITTFLGLIVVIKQWHWKPVWIAVAFGTFILTDLTFLGAVSLKLFEGAWLPLAIAAGVFVIMETWRTGRRVLLEKAYGGGISTERFLERADKTPIRVAGTAIFITPRIDEVPGSLLHNLKHNQVLHERVIFLRVDVQDVPFVPPEKRLTVKKLGKGFYAVEVHFGFFQAPDVPAALEGARAYGLALDLDATTFFIRRETLVPARASALPQMADEAVHQALRIGVGSGAVLSPAAGPRGGTGLADGNLIERVSQRLQIGRFRQHRMHRMIRPGARFANERGPASGAGKTGSAFGGEALGRDIMRAGGEHQKTARRHQRRRSPRELAIGARAALPHPCATARKAADRKSRCRSVRAAARAAPIPRTHRI